MKTLILSLSLLLSSLALDAQKCNRTGSFIGAGDVDVKGSVTLEVQGDGSLVIILAADFVSDQGPDLGVYLGNADRVNGTSVMIKALTSFTGEQMYLVPANIKLADYNYVTIWCTQYSHYYGAALLGEDNGSCSALSSADVPVPAGVELSFTTNEILLHATENLNNVSLSVYSFDGKILYSESIPSFKGTYSVNRTFNTSSIVVFRGEDWVLSEKNILK